MTKIATALFLAVVLAAGNAFAVPRRWTLSQALTGTPPSQVSGCSNAVDSEKTTACGLSLAAARGWRVCAIADLGQTVTGGTLRAYHFDVTQGLWGRVPALDITLTAAGSRMQCSATAPVSVPNGRLYFVPDTVTVSGGTSVVVFSEVYFK